jgi:spore coat protein U-like protein
MVIPLSASAEMSGNTLVSGSVAAPTISVLAPSGILFGQFTFGTPITVKSTTDGSVGVTLGSATNVLWSVVANDLSGNAGYMYSGNTRMTNPLSISNGAVWVYANGSLTYTGTNAGTLPFWAQQTAVPADPAGTYTDTVVFTVAITSFN